MNKNIQLRVLSYGVIAYMLLAFGWWSVLLFTKNKDAFEAKQELLWLGMYAEGHVKNKAELKATPEFKALDEKYKRQEWMIMGEASVFVLSLVIGIWLINRSYHEEVTSAQQRRNFLLSITHELKSPIASISLILETFMKRDLNKAQINKLGTGGIKETKRLHNLVSNLLFAAKVESAYTPTLEKIYFPELIVEHLAHFIQQHPAATFNFNHDDDIPEITGDKMGWTSVIINLIENGIKYSQDNVHIDIQLKKENKKLILEIADQGIGINAKEKKKIFNRFYRVGSEDTRKTKGTGLGLYIVSQIVKAHKASIKVMDNLPKGTKFSIKIDLNQ